MESQLSSKRPLSCVVSSCDKAKYYTNVLLVDPKVSTGASEIHRFELMDKLRPTKRSHRGKATNIINVKWSPSEFDDFDRCLAKEYPMTSLMKFSCS